MTLGNYTPVHQFIFNTVPGINMFRHPFMFNLYATFSMIWVGCTALQQATKNKSIHNLLGAAIIGASITLIISLLFLYSYTDFEHWNVYLSSWKQLTERSPLNNYSHAFIQLSISFILLVSLFLLKHKKHYVRILVVITVVEMVVAVQLNAPLNMYYNVPSPKIDNYLKQTASPTLTNQLASTPLDSLQNKKIANSPGFWVNLNTYTRTTGIDGYNPFIFSTYETLQESPCFFLHY